MMRPAFQVNDYHKVALWSDENKIRMRHRIAFAAGHANFVRHKWHRAIEFTNGFNDHNTMLNSGRMVCQGRAHLRTPLSPHAERERKKEVTALPKQGADFGRSFWFPRRTKWGER